MLIGLGIALLLLGCLLVTRARGRAGRHRA
jgi:hypothetical protein